MKNASICRIDLNLLTNVDVNSRNNKILQKERKKERQKNNSVKNALNIYAHYFAKLYYFGNKLQGKYIIGNF